MAGQQTGLIKTEQRHMAALQQPMRQLIQLRN